MVAQVLVRDLPFGDIDGDNYPPPINSERCYFDNIRWRRRPRRAFRNNLPRRRCRIMLSENSEPVTIYWWVNKDISRAAALKIFIRPIPSKSAFWVIKVQEDNLEMEGLMRYNVVEMLYHWKLDKMRTYQKKKAHQAALYIVFYDNVMKHPKGFYQVPIWWNTYKSSPTSAFTDYLGKGKRPGCFVLT